MKEMTFPRTRKSISNCYTTAFVYPRPPAESFVIKGGIVDIHRFIMTKYTTHPAIVHYVLYHLKGRKSYCSLINMGYLRIRRGIPTKFQWNRRYYYIIDLRKTQLLPLKELRKIPRGWMSDLDQFIPENTLKRIRAAMMEKNRMEKTLEIPFGYEDDQWTSIYQRGTW
jgi:hypothetical protein